jgi:hypothetical protein
MHEEASMRIANAWALPMLLVSALSGSASAQDISMPMGEEKHLSDEEKEKKAEQEKAYKSAIDAIPNQKANADPWGNIRSGNENERSKQRSNGE